MAKQTVEVYQSLMEKILKGEYSSSESLREQDLSEQYGVSRTTIKKCLLMLEKEGFVTIELNRGAKVKSYSLEEVLEFLELRAVLERFIIGKAVPAFTENQIAKLEEVFDDMKIYYNNHELVKYSQSNQLFHGIIHDACTNHTAVNLTRNLKNQMRKYNTKTILIPGRNHQSINEHQAILQAIKNRDVELAESVMFSHINNVRKTFKENYTLLF